jgi:YD repeat-containing protein
VQRGTRSVHQDPERGKRQHLIVRIGVQSMHAGRLVENDVVQSIWIGTSVMLSYDPMKLLLALMLAALMTGAVSAQQRTIYDARGNVVGRASTDGSGTVTNYDARGRVTSRETTSGNTTTIYDASGRNVGRVTTSR